MFGFLKGAFTALKVSLSTVGKVIGTVGAVVSGVVSIAVAAFQAKKLMHEERASRQSRIMCAKRAVARV